MLKYGNSLELEAHQGNCDMCFKKSEKKLIKLIREEPCRVLRWMTVDLICPLDKHDMYRGNKSIFDLLDIAKSEQNLDSLSTFGGGCFCD